MIETVDLLIRQQGQPERVVRLREGVTRIGRAEDNDIVLSDVGISRRHALVVVSRDQVRVEDLGSGNGTLHKGFRVQNQALEDGDELWIDPFLLQVKVRGVVRKPGGESTLPPTYGVSARLEVVAGNGISKSSFPVPPRGLSIGRSETRDVVVPDPAASRHHCSVLPRDNGWFLKDMGSANGVSVNGARVREVVLADGDRIRIGNTEFRFTVGDAGLTDSTTHRVGGVRVRDSVTPVAVARQAGRPGWFWMAVTAGVCAGLFALLLLIGGVGIGVWQWKVHHQVAALPEPAGPRWTLTLPPESNDTADAHTLLQTGLEALKSGDNRAALMSFYRALGKEPGKPAAERLAYAAGEYLILERLTKDLQDAASKQALRERRRDELLGRRTKKDAARELERDYADDPVVMKAMGWRDSKVALGERERLDRALRALSEKKWADGLVDLDALLVDTRRGPVREDALKGRTAARQGLALLTAADWRAGVLAETKGNVDEARSAYRRVLAQDPTNVSAKRRLQRLGG